EITRKHFARPVDAWHDASDVEGQAKNTRAEEQPLDPLEIYVQSLKQELQDVRQSEQLLSAEFQTAYEDARKLANLEMQDERLRGDIDRTRQLWVSIVKRLEEVNLARDFGGYDARTIAPSTPGAQVEPNALTVFTAAALLGILAGLVLAYVADR